MDLDVPLVEHGNTTQCSDSLHGTASIVCQVIHAGGPMWRQHDSVDHAVQCPHSGELGPAFEGARNYQTKRKREQVIKSGGCRNRTRDFGTPLVEHGDTAQCGDGLHCTAGIVRQVIDAGGPCWRQHGSVDHAVQCPHSVKDGVEQQFAARLPHERRAQRLQESAAVFLLRGNSSEAQH